MELPGKETATKTHPLVFIPVLLVALCIVAILLTTFPNMGSGFCISVIEVVGRWVAEAFNHMGYQR